MAGIYREHVGEGTACPCRRPLIRLFSPDRVPGRWPIRQAVVGKEPYRFRKLDSRVCRRHALPLRLVLARSEWAQRQDRAQPLIGVSSLRIYLDLRAALEGLAVRDKPAAAQVFAVG